MPNYDYFCDNCETVTVEFSSYDKRDEPRNCPMCEAFSRRVYINMNTRTEKTSRTFLDGHRNDGLKEEIKAAQLDSDALNHNPKSDKYKELKAEAATRRLLNSTAGKEIKKKTRLKGK